MRRCGVTRNSRASVAIVAGWVAILALATPVQAACADQTSDRVLVPSEPYYGRGAPCSGEPGGCFQPPTPVGGTDVVVPESWQGRPFVLEAAVTQPCLLCNPNNPLGTPPDFAISWQFADGSLLRVDDNEGDERGTVPEMAGAAVVTYRGQSVAETFRLSIDCDGL